MLNVVFTDRFDEKVVDDRKQQFQNLLQQMIEHGQIYSFAPFRLFLGLPQEFSLLRVLAENKQGLSRLSTEADERRLIEYEVPVENWSHNDLVKWLSARDFQGLLHIFEEHLEWDGKFIWNAAKKGDTKALTGKYFTCLTDSYSRTLGITTSKVITIFNYLKQVAMFQRVLSEQSVKSVNIASKENEILLAESVESQGQPLSFTEMNQDELLGSKKILFNTESKAASESTLTGSDMDYSGGGEYLPALDKETLSYDELSRVKFSMDKLRKLEPFLKERAYVILAQNLVIP